VCPPSVCAVPPIPSPSRHAPEPVTRSSSQPRPASVYDRSAALSRHLDGGSSAHANVALWPTSAYRAPRPANRRGRSSRICGLPLQPHTGRCPRTRSGLSLLVGRSNSFDRRQSPVSASRLRCPFAEAGSTMNGFTSCPFHLGGTGIRHPWLPPKCRFLPERWSSFHSRDQ
jgi:hypothetical protein